MRKNKKALWSILAAVIAVWITAVAVYWDTIVMYAAPQIPIGEAFQRVCDDLEARYRESPLPIILKGYEETGLQTAQVALHSANGAPAGRLKVQVDLKNNQILAEGTLPEELKLGEISLYLDRNYAALTSDRLLAGGYYGITYDTFPQDIEARVGVVESMTSSLGAWLLPRTLLQKLQDWLDVLHASTQKMEEQVSSLQKKMDWKLTLPSVPEINMEEVKKIPLALWALRGKVSTVQTEIGGQNLLCYRVVYKIEGETAETLWGLLYSDPFPENGMVQLTCILHQKNLVRMELRAAARDRQVSGTLTLGDAPRTDDLSLEIEAPDGQSLSASIRQEGEWKTLRLADTLLSYQWTPGTGDLILKLPEKDPIPMTLREMEKGFTVESEELTGAMNLKLLSGYGCTASITRGADITSPEYKNLDQWSVEDLMTLLGSVWTLILP